MQDEKTVHLYIVMEVTIPHDIDIRHLNLGLAKSKILDDWEVIEKAKIGTWWIDHVKACNTRYCTCPVCGKIEIESITVLDGKPMCILCEAQFIHGDKPKPRTPEQINEQLGGLSK